MNSQDQTTLDLKSERVADAVRHALSLVGPPDSVERPEEEPVVELAAK